MFNENTIKFLVDLKANNDREWFEANRKIYEQDVRDAAKLFSQRVSELLEVATGNPHQGKIFRIHRDVRFSKDKTPYNSHIRMSYWHSGRPAVWMIGIEPGKLTFGAGVMGFAPEQMQNWRKFVDDGESAALEKALKPLLTSGCRLPDPELKRVPAPYPQDHPTGELLRRKSFTIWRDAKELRQCLGEAGPATCVEALKPFGPIVGWLNENI